MDETIATKETKQPTPNETPNVSQETPFRSFQTQEEFDKFCAGIRKSAEDRAKSSMKIKTENGEVDIDAYNESYKKKIAPTIAKEAVEKYKQELEMTENERFEAEKRAWEQQRRAEMTDINKRLAESMMKEAGFSEKRIEIELNSVSDDREASLGRITELCDLYKQERSEYEKQVMQQIQASNPAVGMGNGEVNMYQQRYDEAKKAGKISDMVHYVREAQEKNIKIIQ